MNDPSSGFGLCDVLAVSVSLRAPKRQRAEGAELQIALIFRAVARALIAGAAIERGVRCVEAALRLPDVAVGVVGEDGELAAQQAAERIGGGAHEAVGDRRLRDVVMAEHVRCDHRVGIVETQRVAEQREAGVDGDVVGDAIGESPARAPLVGRIVRRQGRQGSDAVADRQRPVDAIAVAGKTVGVQRVDAQRIGPDVVAARHRRLRRDRAVAARLHRHRAMRRLTALAGDDVDDAAHRVRAVERRLRPAQHLDALDVDGGEIAEIERAVGRRRIADAHAVDQHQGLAGVGAAQADLGHGADAAGFVDVEAGDAAQDVGEAFRSEFRDLGAGDDRHRGAGLADRLLDPIGRHGDFGQFVGASEARRRQRDGDQGGPSRPRECGFEHGSSRRPTDGG